MSTLDVRVILGTMEDTAKFVTRQEAAGILCVSVRTIDRYIDAGDLTRYKRLNRTMLDSEEVRSLNVTTKVLS